MTSTVAVARRTVPVSLLLVGFACCVAVRVLVAGPQGPAQSVPAGLAFAAGLLLLALAARVRVPVDARAVAAGVGGGVLVCLPVGLGRLVSLAPLAGTAGFVPWVLAVTVVVAAEEAFLRGALYDAVLRRTGSPAWAIGVGAVCFALLHVPLYGWSSAPLDLAVGVVLGMLRQSTGTPAAPFVTHLLADVVGWFVR